MGIRYVEAVDISSDITQVQIHAVGVVFSEFIAGPGPVIAGRHIYENSADFIAINALAWLFLHGPTTPDESRLKSLVEGLFPLGSTIDRVYTTVSSHFSTANANPGESRVTFYLTAHQRQNQPGRYHSGGIVGLNSNEIPVIASPGEMFIDTETLTVNSLNYPSFSTKGRISSPISEPRKVLVKPGKRRFILRDK